MLLLTTMARGMPKANAASMKAMPRLQEAATAVSQELVTREEISNEHRTRRRRASPTHATGKRSPAVAGE